MSDDELPRVHAPVEPATDVPTVARGGGAAIGGDDDFEHMHVAPEGGLTVHHTESARAAEEGFSPYPKTGLAPDRPDRSTLDNSPMDGVVDNTY